VKEHIVKKKLLDKHVLKLVRQVELLDKQVLKLVMHMMMPEAIKSSKTADLVLDFERN
jgi:hypothetical protein